MTGMAFIAATNMVISRMDISFMIISVGAGVMVGGGIIAGDLVDMAGAAIMVGEAAGMAGAVIMVGEVAGVAIMAGKVGMAVTDSEGSIEGNLGGRKNGQTAVIAHPQEAYPETYIYIIKTMADSLILASLRDDGGRYE